MSRATHLSRDENLAGWTDEDGIEVRIITFPEEGHAVIRILQNGGASLALYADLDRADILEVIAHLRRVL